MQVRRSFSHVEIWAPAKINLFFEVLSRRVDGLHEIETLMAPIRLFDTLVVADNPSGEVTLSARWMAESDTKPFDSEPVVDGEPFGDLPKGDKNICVRAVRLLAERSGTQRGAKLILAKRIPSASGLGGGSSDAAAALIGANLVWKLDWPIERLAGVAAELGSDVPFFLGRGAAICRGRGELIEHVAGLPNLHVVVVRPPAGLSTAAVYQECRPGNPPEALQPMLDTLRRGNWKEFGRVAANRLLEPARRLSPWIDRVLNRLAKENTPMIGMSGSGTSCFAVCRNRRDAERVAARLRATREPIGRVWATSTI